MDTNAAPNPYFALLAIFLLGYFLGSIPWGFLIGKLNNVDIRTRGSKNIGATNVTRVVGPGWGKICFLMDFLKGLFGVILSLWLASKMHYPHAGIAKIAGCAGALVGHLFPFWLNFKGGKGVATGAGAACAMAFWPVFLGLVAWVVLFLKTRVVAIASIGAACAVALLAFLFQLLGLEQIGWPVVILIAVIVAIIVYRHKDNIKRLREGKENGFKKSRK